MGSMSYNSHISLKRILELAPIGAEPDLTGGRRWSDDDKARIIVESFVPGANVSEVARRNGLSPQKLFSWRREARLLFQNGDDGDAAVLATASQPPRKRSRARSPQPCNEATSFVPLVIASAPPPPTPLGSPSPQTAAGSIEIMIGDAVVRVVGAIEPAMLVCVLCAVRRSS